MASKKQKSKGRNRMELRVLRYFLAIAREGNMTNAAATLHITQPTLSRQIHDLEDELGQQLFVRNSHSVTLTPEGMLLRKRAEEILELVQKTENEVSKSNETPSGDVYIGAGETNGVHYLTQAAYQIQQRYPGIHFHISSGDSIVVLEQLDKGLIDFGLLFDFKDLEKYNSIKLPCHDTWGVLMRTDSPLADKSSICPADLADQPLILSRQSVSDPALMEWFGINQSALNIIGTYNLVFNGSLMVKDGMGYAVCLDKIINIQGQQELCFRPLKPALTAGMNIVWKKYQIFSQASEKYLEQLLKICL
jgi:DNA-binding transcriptional LysR family regulator